MHFLVRNRWFILFALGALCAVALGTAWYRRSLHNRSSEILRAAEESLKRDIERSLPVGAERSRVEATLRAHEIDYLYYPPSTNVDESASAIIDAYTKYIPTPLLSCKLHLTFKFDERDKLLGYKEKYVCQDILW